VWWGGREETDILGSKEPRGEDPHNEDTDTEEKQCPSNIVNEIYFKIK
jgi:hypothetical protein